MTQPYTLKNILLEKLHRILNPNFSYKFIWALFFAGAGLLGYQRFVQLGGTLEFISDDLKIKLSIPSGVDTSFVIVGGTFILISCFFFYQLVINKETKNKRFKNLKKAAPSIRKILDENRRIFINFGPNSEAGGVEDVRWDLDVWENSKQNIITPNNNKILEILKNIKSYTKEERAVVDKMLNHIEAFRLHCENPIFDYSKHQFPISFSDIVYQYCSGTSDNKAIDYGNWVKNEATNNSISIEEIHVFGSVLYSEDPTDVDVLVKTNVSDIEAIKKQADIWKQISSNFREEHGIDLHLMVFTALEADSYIRFLSKIPKHLSI
jgi:predicted nucleotidyltransferase